MQNNNQKIVLNENQIDDNIDTFTITKNIKNIEPYSFSKKQTKKIIIEDLEKIDDFTFANCKTLEEIELPNNLKQIGDNSFCKCTNLKNIVLPTSLKDIGVGAFNFCSSLKNIFIPENITSINNNAFSECYDLKNVSLPINLTKIGICAFSQCWNLKDILIQDNVELIDSNAFYNCKRLENINLPKNLKKINSLAFAKCFSLKEIIIPDSCEIIEEGIFRSCNSLEKVKLSKKIKEIDKNTFYCCHSLTEINLPENLEMIGMNSFTNCRSLQNINLPLSLKVIDNNAFSDCFNLKNITIPENVIYVGNETFKNCENLKSIHIYSEKLKSLTDDCFLNCKKLKSIEIVETNNSLIEYIKVTYPKLKINTISKEMIELKKSNQKELDLQKINKITPYGIKITEKPMSIDDQIKFYINTNQSFMLHGRSGVGKTRRIEENDPDFVSIVLRNGILPEEVIGKTIFPNGAKSESDKQGIWIPPVWYSTLIEKCEKEQNKNHVLFIDELTNVKPNEQSLVYNLILTRSIGPNFGKLPKNCVVVAAGNSTLESDAAYNMPEPLFRRFVGHIYLNPSVKDFIDWGIEPKKDKPQEQKIHPLVLHYIANFGQNVLYTKYNNEIPPKYTLDPRGWEQVSDIIYENNNILSSELLKNKIGIENAESLIKYATIPHLDIDDILNDNYTFDDLPLLSTGKYLLTLNLRNSTEKNNEKIRDFIKLNLGKEYLNIFDNEKQDINNDKIKYYNNNEQTF